MLLVNLDKFSYVVTIHHEGLWDFLVLLVQASKPSRWCQETGEGKEQKSGGGRCTKYVTKKDCCAWETRAKQTKETWAESCVRAMGLDWEPTAAGLMQAKCFLPGWKMSQQRSWVPRGAEAACPVGCYSPFCGPTARNGDAWGLRAAPSLAVLPASQPAAFPDFPTVAFSSFPQLSRPLKLSTSTKHLWSLFTLWVAVTGKQKNRRKTAE